MVCHDRALSTRIIPYHGIRLYSSQHFQCNIRAAHDGKAGYNPVECTAAVLYSDWLYFLGMVWYKFLYNTMCLNKLAVILTRISTNSLLTFSLIDSILQFWHWLTMRVFPRDWRWLWLDCQARSHVKRWDWAEDGYVWKWYAWSTYNFFYDIYKLHKQAGNENKHNHQRRNVFWSTTQFIVQ